MSVVFSCGEASGSQYGAALTRILVQHNIEVLGIGGRALRDAGATLLGDSSTWGAIGIIESLAVAPKIYSQSRALVRHLKTARPGFFVPIDFGYLNVRLCRLAKRCGWKVVYFMPPGSWRRDKQGADLPSITDEIVTPFPWSAELLQKAGANVHFFGHPLRELVDQSTPQDRNPRKIAALPGSRIHEVQANLEVIEKVATSMGSKVEVAVASNLSANDLSRSIPGGTAQFTEQDTWGVLKRSQAGVICSGTATLEAVLCRTPMVVMYRGSKAMEIEFRIRRPKFDYISLPNILLDRTVVPELIQWDATPERIAANLGPLMSDTPERTAQLNAMEEIEGMLGPANAITKTAELICELVQKMDR